MSGPYKYVIGPITQRLMGEHTVYFAPPERCVGWIDLRSLPNQSVLANSIFTMPADWVVPSEYALIGNGTGDLRELPFSKLDQDAWFALLGVNPQRTATTTLLDALTESLTELADPLGLDTCPPLMPGVNIQGFIADATIVLGGHSVVRRLAAPTLGNGKWGSSIKALLQKDLDEFEAEVVTKRDPNHWQKYWGDLSRAWYGKFDDVKAKDLFTARMLAKHGDKTPKKPTTTVSDNFNGSDSTTLGVQLTWTEQNSGNWEVVSNGAGYNTFNVHSCARAESDLSSSNNKASVQIVRLDDNDSANNYNYFGPACRYHSTDSTNYHGMEANLASITPNNYSLRKWSGSVSTVIGTEWDSGSALSLLEVVANGSTIELWVDGTLRITTTDTTYSSGTRGGLTAYQYLAGLTNRGDDFSASDIAASAASRPIFQRRTRVFAFRG